MVVPVHEGALRVAAPRPNMQFEERWDVETIGSANEVKHLSIEYWRCVVIGGQPRCRVEDELHADQTQLALIRLVDQSLGLRGRA